MAILEHVVPVGRRWAPPAAVPAPGYRARHAGPGRRRFSLVAMFYAARHNCYVPRHARSVVQPARYVPRHARHI